MSGTYHDDDLDIELMMTFARQVFIAAQNTVSSMQDGEHITIKELSQIVGELLSRTSADVLGFVKHFAQHTSEAYMGRGRLIKGSKPVKN